MPEQTITENDKLNEKKITGKNIKELSSKLQKAAGEGVSYKAQDDVGITETLDRIKKRSRIKAESVEPEVEKKTKKQTKKSDSEKTTAKKTTAKSREIKAKSESETDDNSNDKLNELKDEIMEEEPKAKSKRTRGRAKKSEIKEDNEEIEASKEVSKNGIKSKSDKAKNTKDMTMAELLEESAADEEIKEDEDVEETKLLNDVKSSKRNLKNISEAIISDNTKRKNGKNSAAIVMATITGNKDSGSRTEEEFFEENNNTGFPMDVSMIDFEKERYGAEEDCIADFRQVVAKLEEIYDEKNKELTSVKDELLNELSDADRNIEVQMKNLKIRQSEIVNQIAQIQEVIAGKQSELNNLSLFQITKRNRIRQIIKDSETEIGTLEMEALAFKNKVTNLMEDATHRRVNLFSKVDNVKEQSDYTKGKLEEAKDLLKKMEKREYIDEAAVQRKLILNALRLYTKPMTIGQLLHYPGLFGYSVQTVSSAMHHLVTVDKTVIKVDLEDNVYYLISKAAMNVTN